MSSDRCSQTTTGRHPATLLVFTLDPLGERARRRLLPGRLGSWELALYRQCLDAALAAGRANGCALSVCAPRRLPLADDVEQFPQEGCGFGPRLRRAVASRQPSPERPLVVVGSDAPELEPRHVADALAHLEEKPDGLVVGPSPDGGFYLLAAARPLDELLAEVAWLQGDTLASLLAAAQARGVEVSLLAPLADLDRAADLTDWLHRRDRSTAPWLRRLVALLHRLRRPPLPRTLGRPLVGRAALVPARGPPG
jgi:2-phospho-L-lactate guanylyltransferase (CobY/MobA/RfbA family)